MPTSKRFSLRCLLLLFVPISCFLALTSYKLRQAAYEQYAAKRMLSLDATLLHDYEIDENGAISGREPRAPPWMDRWFGTYLFQHVAIIRFAADVPVTRRDLDDLEAFHSLRELKCDDTNVDDHLVSIIATHQRNLPCLSLSGCRITDDCLDDIGKMSNLRHLTLAETPITDSQLDVLSNLPNLVVLDISATRISEDGLQRLTRSRSLRSIVAFDMSITEACVQRLKVANPDCEIVARLPQ